MLKSDEKQTVERKDVAGGGVLPEFRVHVGNHTPSWTRRWNEGTAQFRAMMHTRAGWLSLTMSEGYEIKPQGQHKGRTRWIGKETMLTLEPEAARALYDFLKFHFENKAATDALDNEPINVEDELEVFP